jgi:protein-tyrosine phosphatase
MLTLANSDFLLIELPHYLSGGIKLLSRVLFEIQMQGYIPILAHPERAMISEGIFETLLEWYVQGKVMIQINASSLINDPRISPDRQARYSKRRKYAKMLLEANIVDFISSDAHDDNERPPQNYLARYEVSREYGQSIANNLFSLNAKKILNNYII